MAYSLIYGTDEAMNSRRCETATEALDVVKELQTKHQKNIKVSDRKGTEITIAELERLASKENI
jgi:hypothetical protein